MKRHLTLRNLAAVVVARRGARLCRVLDRDDAGDGARVGAAAIHAERSTTARPCSTSAAARPATPCPTRIRRRSIARGSAAAWRSVAVRHFLRAEHFARSEGRHRRLERGGFRHRDVGRHGAGRLSPFPAFPYTSYRHMELDDVRDLFAYLKTLPPVAGQGARTTIWRFPSTSAAWSAAGSFCFSRGGPFVPDPAQIGAMESRRLSGQRPGALRRMPLAAQFSRRHHRERTLCRRPDAGRQRLGAEHHAGRPRSLGRATRSPGRKRISPAFSTTA